MSIKRKKRAGTPIYEMPVVLDLGSESADHLGVRQILLLGRHRQGEMVFDQPPDEFDGVARESVGAAKARGINAARRRMVAAAALGDIVKQPREVKQLRMLEVTHQAAAERKLVRELGYREAPQVAP